MGSMIDNCRSTCGLCSSAPSIPGGGSCASEGCECVEADVLADYAEYNAMMLTITDGDKCKSFSGKFKKKACSPAKKQKAVKCAKASNDMEACKTLGCDLIWSTNDDGSKGAFSCGGSPKAFA